MIYFYFMDGCFGLDLIDLAHRRIDGARVKHRVRENWLNGWLPQA